MSDLELFYNELNVGKTITCLLHSFRTETPCVLLEPMPPFNLDSQYNKYDFSFLGIENPLPLQLWDRLCFLLSMSGLLLFPNNVLNYRKEDGKIIILSNYNKKIIVNYEKLNEFDDLETGWNYVYDFYDWRSGGIHDVNEIIDEEDNFIKKVLFYSSERERVNSQVKDLVGVSYLSTDEINEMEVSPIYSRLKILRMIEKRGIKGNIVSYNVKGQPKHRKPVIEFRKRIIKPHFMPKMTFSEVYSLKQTYGYTWKLLEKITQHTII